MSNNKSNNSNTNIGTKFLPSTVTKKTSIFSRFRDWVNKKVSTWNFGKFSLYLQRFSQSINHFLRSFLLLGLVSLLVVHFCPEIGAKYPVLFQFLEGVLEVYNFLLQVLMTLLKFLLEIVTLRWIDAFNTLDAFFTSMFSGLSDLFSQFVSWLETVSF